MMKQDGMTMLKWINIKVIALASVAAVIAATGVWYYHHATVYPSTEDAYVNAHSVHIVAQVSGKVKSVNVSNDQRVAKGQVLFSINAASFLFEVNKAKANLALTQAKALSLKEEVNVAKAKIQKAKANLFVATQNNTRLAKLVKGNQVSVQAADQAKGSYRSAKAALLAAQESLLEAKRNVVVGQHQVDVSQALLSEAQLKLSYTKVKAPNNG
jgi:membrane fusion protein (multidrug efflux system)